MAKRKILFIATAPLLLLLGMMLSFRILSQLPQVGIDGISAKSEVHQPAPKMLPANAALQKALEVPVRGQLSAIRKADYASALTFSAPSFRESWNAKRFQEMVEAGYKEMTESTREDFETGLVADNAANVRVVVTTTDNSRIGYIFNLTRDGDDWYVRACSPGYPVGAVTEASETGARPKRGNASRPQMTPQL
jgi:hypothetical protein